MSKKIGYYQNADFSSLNVNDSEVNSGLLDGCKIIFYTSPMSSPSTSVITLNSSDPTQPRLVKSDLNSDPKDVYIFNVISSKSGNGYLLQSITGGWYWTATPGGTVIGTKDISAVWRFVQMGGKSNPKCKLQLITTDNTKVFLAERGEFFNVVASSGADNTQWNLGFVSFGPKTFSKLLKDNPLLEKQCCVGNLPANLKPVCTLNKYTSGSALCKKVAGNSGPSDVAFYDVIGLDVSEEQDNEEQDNKEVEDRALNVVQDKFSTAEIILGVGIIVLIGISIYVLRQKK
jgi:hypothetical protein